MSIRKKGQSRVQIKCPECNHVFLPSLEETQSRAGVSARRKGHTFERAVAKKLKVWWLGNHDFKRTPQSGGSALKEGWGLAGDIATTAPDFIWHLELKNTPGSFKGLHQFMSADKFVFWNWLKQAEADCPKDKEIMIIFNRFDQPTWCAAPCTASNYIQDRLERSNIDFFMLFRNLQSGTKVIYIWKLEDMLSSSPENWK